MKGISQGKAFVSTKNEEDELSPGRGLKPAKARSIQNPAFTGNGFKNRG
jgi:hypothetical protein